VQFFRAVSEEEWDELLRLRAFQPTSASLQGKWFAGNAADAARWGRRFFRWDRKPLFVVEVSLPNALAALFWYASFYDRIGPAWFVDVDQLPLLNQNIIGGIRLVLPIPTIPP
jgi:hypothetical protein